MSTTFEHPETGQMCLGSDVSEVLTELRDALKGVIGLVQLVSGRFPPEDRDDILQNHRMKDARLLLLKIGAWHE